METRTLKTYKVLATLGTSKATKETTVYALDDDMLYDLVGFYHGDGSTVLSFKVVDQMECQ